MSWILLASASHIFWGTINVIDKHLIDKKISHPFIYVMWLGLFGGGTILLIPFINFYWLPFSALAWIFLTAIISLLAGFCYVKAISLEEISRINFLWPMITVITFLVSGIFFGEVLSHKELLAYGVFLLGSFAAAFHLTDKKISFSKGFVWMFLACLLYAAFSIIFDRLAINISPYLLFVYSGLANFTISFFCLVFYRKDHQAQKINIGLKLFGLIALVGILTEWAELLSIQALSSGPIALVTALVAVQLIFVFTVSVLLTNFFPKIIQEKIDFRNLFLKFLALVCVVAGIWILNY